MTTNKGRGRSRKRKMTPIRRMADGLKKATVYLVCTALVLSSMSGSFAMAAQNDDTDGAETEIFEMDIESLCDAMESAVNDGDPVAEGDYEFTGSNAQKYDRLFDTEGGLLYEIYPDLDSDGDSLTLKTFVKLNENAAVKEITEDIEGDDSLDDGAEYIISGDEQIIFLLVNDTDDDADARIQVSTDDETYETPLITVPGNRTSITLSTASLEMPMEYATVDEKTENVKTAALYAESGSDAFYESGNETEFEEEDEGEIKPEEGTEEENESPEEAETETADEMNGAASGSASTAGSSSAHSEGCISMSGTVYDAVKVNGESAVAFAMTAKALGMDKLSADYSIIPLMDGTGSTFPVNTIYRLSVTWTTSGTGETVYSWTRNNHVTSENNSDQSTIDALASGSYRVEISFENIRSDQTLQIGQSYVLALDWPTGEGVTVTPGGTSGTITTNGTELATWELNPETGEITFTILSLTDENSFSLYFTATVEKANDDEPEGDDWEANGSIRKDGEIDELVDDKITYTITAVVPRYSLSGGKAYVWSVDDRMQVDTVYGGDSSNDMSDVEIVMTSTQYPGGIIVPSVENATEEDEYAYYVKVDSDKEDEIIFLNRCTCDESDCANWSDGCGNLYDDTGFCSCWLSIYNATFTITYSVDISEIVQGMEDRANTSAAAIIMNSAFLYNGGEYPVDNNSDQEYVYHPFTKSETTNPDRNTENKGVGNYEINIYEHDVDYSWADDIEVTDVMDNLALVENSLTVTVGDTVLTLIDEEEAAKLDPETNHDKYYSYTYTEVTEDGKVTGGTLVIKIWYPTNKDITIEYQASVLSYNTSSTGDYSNSVTIGEVGYTLQGSYQEGSSGEGGSGLTLSMTLTKVDANDDEVVLPGAVFEIYRHVEDDDDILVDTLTTGEDGTFTFASNDDKGYWMDRDVLYYVKEIEAPEGYTPDTTLYGFVFLRNGYDGTYPDGLDPQNVILGEPDGDQIHIEITVENPPTSVKIFKYATDEDGTKNPLEGAEFVLSKTESTDEGAETTVYASFTGENGSYVFSEWVDSEENATTLTTGEDGYICITYLSIGTYDLTETKAPYGYVTLDDPIEVVVSGNNDSETPALVNVENKEPEPQINKEIAEDDYERKDEDIEHDDSNGNFEENVDGDGWGTWDDADNNQEVTYHIILSDIKDAVNLTVHDYLEAGLDFESDTVSIVLYDNDEGTTLTSGTDYTLTQTDTCSDPGNEMDGCTFEVAFEDSVFSGISSDAYIVITYDALADTSPDEYDDYEDAILNHSYMTYGPDSSYRSDIVTTETDLFGFGVYKYTDEDGEEIALAGAEFVLERGGVYATFSSKKDSSGNDFYMISGWVEDKESAGTLISGSDGMIRIEGLDDDIYTLTETKAPVGYDIIEEAITVEIDEDGNVTINVADDSKETVIGHVVNVENDLTLINIEGTKTWNDDDNQDGKRPTEITIHLLADGTEVASKTVTAADGWAWSFTDLPEYNNGVKITYTITEDVVEDYTTEVDGYDIENSHTPGKVGINVQKLWDDADDQDGIRPESIEVELVKNGDKTGITLTLDEDNEWSGSFSDLDEYTDGVKNEYTVAEIEVEGYVTTITDPDGTTSFIITNSHTPETVSLEGTKVWDDDDDHYGKRPESITVHLFADDTEIDSVTVTADDDWNWSFTGLDKYRDGGIEIVYTVTEDEVDGYDTDITEGDDGTVTITNTIIPEPKMTKELAEDDYERKDEDIEHDDSNGHFEENVDGDGWGTWDDADNNQEVTYRLILTDIKNATNLTVHDYLEEGLDFEPDTIEIDLYDGGKDTVLSEGTDYTEHEGTCTDPNGCAMAGCTFEVEFEDNVFEGISVDAYLVITYKALTDTYEEDYDDYVDEILNHSYMTYGINSYRSSIVTTATDLFGFGVYKYADEDGEEVALAGAEFVLERNGVYATFDTEIDDDGIDYYMISGWVENIDSADTLTSGEDGMIRIEGLDDDTYTLTETKAPTGYEIMDETITIVIDEDGNVTVSGNTGSKEAVIGHVVNVENTEILTEVSGTKTWNDNDNEDGKRPESITIHLMADGTEVDSKTVTAEDGWSWSFTSLPEYKDGVKITYTITEDVVEDYTTKVNGYDVENSHTPGKVGLNVQKIWDDKDDQDGIRPDSITVELVMNGEKTGDTLKLDESNDWSGSFTDLDEYTDGTKNEYTVAEIEVDGYVTTVTEAEGTSSIIITNTHTPETEEETRDISGTKTWDDDDDKADARPASITVNLYQNDKLYSRKTVTADDGWTYSWTGLPKYDEDGKEYAYTIDEEKVEYYDPTYHEGDFDITNTFVGEEGAEHPTPGPEKGGDTPKTGDTNSLGVWLALLVAALACVLVAFRMRKRS